MQEFFQLLIRELFLPDYGMFEYHEDTREYWFSPAALEIGVSKTDFKMVGIVLGLVWNSARRTAPRNTCL